MKKAAALILLIVFLITNSGVTITTHWCGGKLSSFSVLSTTKKTCKCGKKAMKPSCCKDKSKQLKSSDVLVKGDHQISNIKLSVIESAFVAETHLMLVWASQYQVMNVYQPPPPKPGIPIYLLDMSIRI